MANPQQHKGDSRKDESRSERQRAKKKPPVERIAEGVTFQGRIEASRKTKVFRVEQKDDVA